MNSLIGLFARSERLVTWKRARVYSLLLLALYLVAWGWVVYGGQPPLNRSGQPIGGDFIAFYSAGQFVLSGNAAHLYEHDPIALFERAALDKRVGEFYDAFRNPPFFALLFVPFAFLPYLPAYAMWFVVSSGFLALAMWLLLREIPEAQSRWRGLMIVVLAFSPVYFGLIDGENATLSLLLYVLIFRALRRGDNVQVGLWSALGLFKPQLFIVFPFVLLARHAWRGLLAYVGIAAILGIASVVVVGPDAIQSWIRILVEPESSNTLQNGWRMASLKSMLDVLLPDAAPLALLLYLAGACVLLLGVLVVWRKREVAIPLAFAYTSLAAVLIDPHLVDYDLTILVPAGVLLAVNAAINRWWFVALYVSTLLRINVPIGESTVQITSLALCGLVLVTWWRLHPRAWPLSGRVLATCA